jgi:uncharacterized protein (TIGR03083 family)
LELDVDVATALIEQNDEFAEVLRGADEATPVPTCPGWTLRHLMRHVGRGDRWAGQIVADRLSEALDPREVRGGKPPDDGDGAIDWLKGGARQLIDAVDLVGPETSVWTFLGPRPASWWLRRRLHEATVHRADAELALGREFQLSTELAVDGLSEWLERVIAEAGDDVTPLNDGQALHLDATDGGEWILRGTGNPDPGVQLGKSEATVSADATSLFLAVVRRIPADDPRIEIHGAREVWDTWLDRTPF